MTDDEVRDYILAAGEQFTQQEQRIAALERVNGALAAQVEVLEHALDRAERRACAICSECGSMKPPPDWTWCECDPQAYSGGD